MPYRGDDLESLVTANAIAHLANVDVIYTERAYAGSHPNSKSLELYRVNDSGGIYETTELIAPDGAVAGIHPQVIFYPDDVPNYSQGARITIVQHSTVYEVAEVDDSREGEVAFIIRKLGEA
jgi:hypothetical protein